MRVVCLAAGLAASAASVALAQETPQAVTRVFTPEDFSRFAPQTALDMVIEIPGFTIEREDSSRGFGQASGNVLINGERISGKSNDAVDALGRIPADRVIRMELSDGTMLDIPGLSGQVVNVVADGDGISGTWSWQTRLRERLEPNFLTAEASVSGRTGRLAWTLSLESDPAKNGNAGVETVTDGGGNLIEIRDEEAQFIVDAPSAALALTWTSPKGRKANFNAAFEQFNRNNREIGFRSPVDGVDSFRLFKQGRDERSGEVSADYEFPLGPGALKLIGLYTIEDGFSVSDVEETPADGAPAFGSRFEQDQFESETVARAEYAIAPRPGRDWQIAVEGARNVLDVESGLFILQDDGTLAEEDLANSTTRVVERRAELTVTHGRSLASSVNVQASLGVEVSELAQSGPAGLTRGFFRPKGFVSATWRPGPRTSVQARIAREVGQLNFFDFVSSVNLNNENANAGNPDLVPEQSWAAEIEIDRRFGGFAAATLRLFGDRIEDIIDQVPLPGGGEGPGNIDSALRYGAELTATLQLDILGWTGAQLEFEGQARNSRLDDPLTGLPRRISRDLVSRVEVEVRYDIPNTPIALEVGFNQSRRARTFRLDEINFNRSIPGFLFAVVEHKDIFGLTGFIEVGNLIDQRDLFTREIFETDRLGPIDFIEDRNRDFGPILTFGLSGSF